MKIITNDLLNEIIFQTKNNILTIEKFLEIDTNILNYKASEDKWSYLECIEHLNLYGNFYLPEIQKSIKNSRRKNILVFKSGIIGNYFVKSMLPKEKLNKMKTFEDKDPKGSTLNEDVLTDFIEQQYLFIGLVELSKNINIVKAKTSISISKLIKLRLGDTFRFLMAHNARHLLQAEKALIN